MYFLINAFLNMNSLRGNIKINTIYVYNICLYVVAYIVGTHVSYI